VGLGGPPRCPVRRETAAGGPAHHTHVPRRAPSGSTTTRVDSQGMARPARSLRGRPAVPTPQRWLTPGAPHAPRTSRPCGREGDRGPEGPGPTPAWCARHAARSAPGLDTTASAAPGRDAAPGERAHNALACACTTAHPTRADVASAGCLRTHERRSRRRDTAQAAVRPRWPADLWTPHPGPDGGDGPTPSTRAGRPGHDPRARDVPDQRQPTPATSPGPAPGHACPTPPALGGSEVPRGHAPPSGHARARGHTAARGSVRIRLGGAPRGPRP
jgi:hypothetical protein